MCKKTSSITNRKIAKRLLLKATALLFLERFSLKPEVRFRQDPTEPLKEGRLESAFVAKIVTPLPEQGGLTPYVIMK